MTNPPGNPNIKNIGFKKKENCTPEQWAKQKEYWNRQKGVPKTIKWTKEKCNHQLGLLMDILEKKINDDDFKELSIIIDKMMDIIKYLYPPITQSKNLNLNVNKNIDSSENLQRIWLKEQNTNNANNTNRKDSTKMDS